jgi:signal transduction histidine kinase
VERGQSLDGGGASGGGIVPLKNDRLAVVSDCFHASGGIDKTLSGGEQGANNFLTLGMAVHGLKNPVSGIAVAAEYLIEDGSSEFTEKQLLLLRGILKSASSMLRLIDQITETSKAEHAVAARVG